MKWDKLLDLWILYTNRYLTVLQEPDRWYIALAISLEANRIADKKKDDSNISFAIIVSLYTIVNIWVPLEGS